MQTKARQQDSDQDKGELTALSGLPPLPQRPLDAGLLEYELVGGENMKDFVGTTHEDLSAQLVTQWGMEHTQPAEFQNLDDFMLTYNFSPHGKDPSFSGDIFG